jgi:hypothetical protein
MAINDIPKSYWIKPCDAHQYIVMSLVSDVQPSLAGHYFFPKSQLTERSYRVIKLGKLIKP